MDRKLSLVGAVLWILGVAATIVGLNIKGDAGTWLMVGGNIAFLLGLALQGVLWARRRNTKADGNPPSADP